MASARVVELGREVLPEARAVERVGDAEERLAQPIEGLRGVGDERLREPRTQRVGVAARQHAVHEHEVRLEHRDRLRGDRRVHGQARQVGERARARVLVGDADERGAVAERDHERGEARRRRDDAADRRGQRHLRAGAVRDDARRRDGPGGARASRSLAASARPEGRGEEDRRRPEEAPSPHEVARAGREARPAHGAAPGTTIGTPRSGSATTRNGRPKSAERRGAVRTSAGGPSATTRPASRRRTRSANAAARLTSWSAATTARAALAREAAHDGEEAGLLAEVEVGRGLVEEEERRALRETPRDGDAAALAARERVHAPVRERDEVGGRERVGDGSVVGRAGRAPRRDVGEATEGHDLAHAERRLDGVVLRDAGDEPGRRADRERREVVAVHGHAATARAQEAGGRAQQRGLAGAVAPDDRHDGAGVHRERQPVEGRDRAVARDDVVEFEERHAGDSPSGTGREPPIGVSPDGPRPPMDRGGRRAVPIDERGPGGRAAGASEPLTRDAWD